MQTSPARVLLSLPILSAVVAAAGIWWLNETGHVARVPATALLVLLWLLITGIWWIARGRGRRLPRAGVVLGAGAGLFLAGRYLVKYEGSADGSALPRLSWRWSKPALEDLPSLPEGTGPVTDLGAPPPGMADAPRFMGPAGDGVVPDPGMAMATDWKVKPPREVWRQPVGLGWSGFAVAGRRAITQEQRGEEEHVTCYDAATGRLLWAHKDTARFSEGMGGDGPRSTPTIDLEGKVVFALGATGILNCLELETGKRRWSRNILEDAGSGNITWAKSNAPLLHGPHVIVSGGTGAPTLLALRRDTGEVAWKSGSDAASYSSPVLMTLAGAEQIVSVNQTSVTGHDPVDGKVLWTFDWPGGMPKVSQPIAAGKDRVLATASYGMKSHLLEITRDGSGAFHCAAVWTSGSPRTKFSSPAIIGDHLYAMDEGVLASVNLADGERVWREGRYGYGQHLIVGGHLLIQTEQGDVVLVKPSAEKLEEVARLKALDSKTWNPPTLAGRWLLVRNDREAVCFEIPEK